MTPTSGDVKNSLSMQTAIQSYLQSCGQCSNRGDTSQAMTRTVDNFGRKRALADCRTPKACPVDMSATVHSAAIFMATNSSVAGQNHGQ